jgi:toxin ParE1/3/4
LAKVTWLIVALDDVQSIFEFVAQDSVSSAERLANRIFSATDRLGSFPLSGRVVPEIDDQDVREIIVGNYRLMYHVLADEIEVLAVIHSARLLPAQRVEIVE